MPQAARQLSDLENLVRARIERLRPKLLDLSRRNPLISTSLSPRSNALVRVVDELPEDISARLMGQKRMRFTPLPPLEAEPRDEKTKEFQDALSQAHHTDETYIAAMESLDVKQDGAIDAVQKLERELRDRVRESLGLAPRQQREDISLPRHAANNGISASYDLPAPDDAHADGRHDDSDIQTLFLPEDLERKLNALTSKCRTWVQETGINVLHVAFGFLEWTEPGATTSSFAPLVLLPVEIEKKKSPEGAEFYVRGLSDRGETNLVLAQKLRQLNVELPPYEGGSLEDYFALLAQTEPKVLKWKVRRQVAFGVFPSARLAMFMDLDTGRHAFDASQVVTALLGGSDTVSAMPFADEYSTDAAEVEHKAECLVMDADASQVSTIVDVADGKNLAVEGPPGTGKSQTIVNTIAVALSTGKKVLFIAEKKAALDVVKARLDMVGLGEFVLPLQAERSGREQVVQSLRDRWDMKAGAVPPEYEARRTKFAEVRSSIARYLEVIAAPFGASGLTVHQVLGRNIATGHILEAAPAELRRPKIPDIETLTQSKLDSLQTIASEYEAARAETASRSDAWAGLTKTNLDKFSIDHLLELAAHAAQTGVVLAGAMVDLREASLPADLDPRHVHPIAAHMKALAAAGDRLDIALIARTVRGGCVEAMQTFAKSCARVQQHQASIATIVEDSGELNWPSRLREIAEICAAESLSAAKPDELRASMASLHKSFEERKGLYKSVEPLVRAHPACAESTLGQIGRAFTLVKQAGPRALALRGEATRAAAAYGGLSALCRRGRQIAANLAEARSRLAERPVASVLELEGYAQTLSDSGFFDRFGAKYAAAKRFYRAHTKAGERFAPAIAAQRLRHVADAMKAADAFQNDASAAGVFGHHFAGVETEFEPFEQLAQFCESVEFEFNTADASAVRVLLLSAASETLALIPELESEFRTVTFRELTAYLRQTQTALRESNEDLARLESLIQGLRAPHELTPEQALKAALSIEETTKVADALDHDNTAKDVLGRHFHGAHTDATTIGTELKLAAEIAAAPDLVAYILPVLDDDAIKLAHARLSAVLEKDQLRRAALMELKEASGKDFIRDELSAEIGALDAAAGDRNSLIAHSRLAAARTLVNEVNIGWVADEARKLGAPRPTLPELVAAIFFRAMAMKIYDRHGETLNKYSGPQLDALRAELAAFDRDLIRLTRRHLRARLARAAKPPPGRSTGRKSEWTEMALIHNEMSKQQQYVAVRDLTNRAGRALLELKPCWMMSPLAVAQYLTAGSFEFDLCIIDEASQMPPEDALGALVRCKQAVIVGDTNQLPPSNFFRKMFDDDDADEDEAVLEESVLELAKGAFRPGRRLRWHYRSRHSGLIQFSNRHVYDGDLVVFPSASEGSADMGVLLVKVDGRYKAGVNADEARAMIDAAIAFTRKHPDRSLGIVTMNQKQRDLLQEEWDSVVARDPDASAYVEKWATQEDGIEEFFIKNLENVQGDERDVIFIGTVYGPETPGGPVMQRFGPINGVAGKRRLNVLFSRAKKQIVTFSSMTAADVRAEENGNVGAYMLKRWLEYAATGQIETGERTQLEPDSDFEQYVIDQLRAMGCEPVPQVGASGYRIDIGVKHPSWPHGYILAVECDGASYHSSRSARDRDRLRQEVLEGLGWRFHRIWSVDWFNDPKREAERLRDIVARRLSELTGAH
ncbi:MAG: DUF4011 domain-containing protein [Terricaulis silvestris]